MESRLVDYFKQAFKRQAPIHPIDRGMAKYYIKRRLVALFPSLRNDPRGLEEAYRSLTLSPKPGSEEGDAETVFEMSFPEEDADSEDNFR